MRALLLKVYPLYKEIRVNIRKIIIMKKKGKKILDVKGQTDTTSFVNFTVPALASSVIFRTELALASSVIFRVRSKKNAIMEDELFFVKI